MEEAAAQAAIEEHRIMKTQLDLQDRYRLDLEKEKMVTAVSVCFSQHYSFVPTIWVDMRDTAYVVNHGLIKGSVRKPKESLVN